MISCSKIIGGLFASWAILQELRTIWGPLGPCVPQGVHGSPRDPSDGPSRGVPMGFLGHVRTPLSANLPRTPPGPSKTS